MSYDEALVGSIAILVGIVACVIAAGAWETPYHLRTIQAVSTRFGKPAARATWLLIALAAFAAGAAIMSGIRPSYANPTEHSVIDR